MLDSHIDKHLVFKQKVSSAKFNEQLKYLNAEGKAQRTKPSPPKPKVRSESPNISPITAVLLAISCLGMIFAVIQMLT